MCVCFALEVPFTSHNGGVSWAAGGGGGEGTRVGAQGVRQSSGVQWVPAAGQLLPSCRGCSQWSGSQGERNAPLLSSTPHRMPLHHLTQADTWKSTGVGGMHNTRENQALITFLKHMHNSYEYIYFHTFVYAWSLACNSLNDQSHIESLIYLIYPKIWQFTKGRVNLSIFLFGWDCVVFIFSILDSLKYKSDCN